MEIAKMLEMVLKTDVMFDRPPVVCMMLWSLRQISINLSLAIKISLTECHARPHHQPEPKDQHGNGIHCYTGQLYMLSIKKSHIYGLLPVSWGTT